MVLVHHMRPSGYSWFSTTELMFLTGKHLTRQETFKKTFFINIFRRCNPEPSYSFTGCVRESLSKKIGCKLKWDSWTSEDVPRCQHLDQYRLVSSTTSAVQNCDRYKCQSLKLKQRALAKVAKHKLKNFMNQQTKKKQTNKVKSCDQGAIRCACK